MSALDPALAGTQDHPHARMVLGAALAAGDPSHAYLFHGPPGTGKRTAARALAAELLAESEPDPEAARARVHAGTHPDLTWVRPTGAHVMRVSDVDEPVVAAATRTPFEASRRVFVLERADTMNDEVANRMLKTLEEPADFVHLILLTDALGQVLETVVSRCQLVRFDPLPAERIAAILEDEGVDPARAGACGRLALGNLTRARYLASEEGEALRDDVERMVRDALAGEARDPREGEPWAPLLARAEARREATEDQIARTARSASSSSRAAAIAMPSSASSTSPPSATAGARAPRSSTSASSWRRCRSGISSAWRRTRRPRCWPPIALRSWPPRRAAATRAGCAQAVERCEDARLSLELNVTEELALSALTLRLARLVGSPA